MTALVTLGCLMAAMPLLVALLLAGSVLDSLTRHTEALVQEGVRVSQFGGQLRDQVRDLARNADQFAALGDPVLLKVMDERIAQARTTMSDIEKNGAHSEVARFRQQLADAARAWKSSLNGTLRQDIAVEQFRALIPAADAVVTSGAAAIERQVQETSVATAQAHRVLALAGFALLPLTALFAYVFSRAITRPLRQLSLAITRMGHGHYGEAISISYPQEMRALGEKLEWLRLRARALEAEKDRFLRHVSHELKTPLATLQEGSMLLREGSLGSLSVRQREVANILGEASLELGMLIGNLLSYAEWRQGERRAGMEWFDTNELVDEVVAAHRLTLKRRGIAVDVGNLAPLMYGQRSRLRVALDNLVGNAIKHAPDGSVIDIASRFAGHSCELTVRDRGRGVPAEARDRIFEPFVRGAEPEEAAVRGTGIGLSIVRETALAHAGNVEVTNADPGAAFRMVWPCPAPDHARPHGLRLDAVQGAPAERA